VLDQPIPGARILVVEDEPLIRMIAVEALLDAGFEVGEAANAAEAMAHLDRGDVRFDAAIIDIGLPDRPGDLLAQDIRAVWPDLPIVIASGRGDAQIADRFSADRRVRILGKPYHNEALCDALAALGVRSAPRA
jgi:DNA-binding response OmpR family regulator